MNDTAHVASLQDASEPASSSPPTDRDVRVGIAGGPNDPEQDAALGDDDQVHPMGADAEPRRLEMDDGQAAGGPDESRPYSTVEPPRAVGARFIAPATNDTASNPDDPIGPPEREHPASHDAEQQGAPTVTLILGGARSGKSTLAERLAAESGRPVLYLATSVPFDDEMRERIAVHRSDRPSGWHTVEEPLRIAAALREHARTGDLVLLDCLTVWLSNRLLDGIGPDRDPDSLPAADWTALETAILAETDALLAVARARGVALILVSNEVGMGVVPAYPLGRRYRDALGRVNQRVAAYADTVLLTVAGLPLDLKRLAATSQS